MLIASSHVGSGLQSSRTLWVLIVLATFGGAIGTPSRAQVPGNTLPASRSAKPVWSTRYGVLSHRPWRDGNEDRPAGYVLEQPPAKNKKQKQPKKKAPAKKRLPQDDEVDQPQPPPIPSPPTPAPLSPFQTAYYRHASTPNMFGDTPGGQVVGTLIFPIGPGGPLAVANIASAGGARCSKIAENNKALPVDRAYFMYNYFNKAFRADPDRRALSIKQYTAGYEKTFGCGRWSIDVRLPFTSQHRFVTENFEIGGGGDICNLNVAMKHLLHLSDHTVLSAGLGVDVPTASNVSGRVNLTTYTVHNEAVFLQPFVGFQADSEHFFVHGFAQLDVAANGNPIEFQCDGISSDLGKFNDQTLLYLDVALGRWLYRNPCSRVVTGFAALAELHYTATLQDPDTVVGPCLPNAALTFSQSHRHILNFTVGLHAEIVNNTEVRVAAVYPARNRPDRSFDSEIQVQVNRRF